MLSCAKQQQTVEEEKEELDLLREKITAARQQGEDLEPERKALGFSLKTVYNERLQANKKQQDFQKDNKSNTRPEKQLGNRHRNMGKRKRLPAVKSKRR